MFTRILIIITHITQVIVIAATNFPEMLDPALVRPGRFDTQVQVRTKTVRYKFFLLFCFIGCVSCLVKTVSLNLSSLIPPKQVPLPDLRGREKILKVHAKDVPLADPSDLRKIARGTSTPLFELPLFLHFYYSLSHNHNEPENKSRHITK